MGTVGVPERYAIPHDGQIVEIRYLYCHPVADGKLIQAKYFGKIRDDVARGDCSVSQLKLKADESDPTECQAPAERPPGASMNLPNRTLTTIFWSDEFLDR